MPLTHNRSHKFDRWGHIARLAAYRQPLYLNGPGGIPYVADTHGGSWVWDLRCDCGHTWTIDELEFPGKWKMRSCMRPECPHTPGNHKRKPVEQGVSLSAYVPASLASQVNEYAVAKSLTGSKAMAELLREGLIAKLINDEDPPKPQL